MLGLGDLRPADHSPAGRTKAQHGSDTHSAAIVRTITFLLCSPSSRGRFAGLHLQANSMPHLLRPLRSSREAQGLPPRHRTGPDWIIAT
ncbi:hypothetical protein CONPUDRAFT_138397 [Coniophora puteana RWD-64-598 SS2]|uniref:Uncharacterized protein n=1 Tax=Coniophora puteana (strain RWD-64-598) TaxID=741705 RepID=A0A5M3MJ25_CONPW|nr:uncharacterized protein CONPUDRAFT_138397 [Coniophora puteana RWD-64-598 SS2]EIW79248.1 hypothetical protein CONPUDRAFT_138397 [Coniophora puteana RWD-64-598 SS2]